MGSRHRFKTTIQGLKLVPVKLPQNFRMSVGELKEVLLLLAAQLLRNKMLWCFMWDHDLLSFLLVRRPWFTFCPANISLFQNHFLLVPFLGSFVSTGPWSFSWVLSCPVCWENGCRKETLGRLPITRRHSKSTRGLTPHPARKQAVTLGHNKAQVLRTTPWSIRKPCESASVSSTEWFINTSREKNDTFAAKNRSIINIYV